MGILYCPACSNYLMSGDGECHDCFCGWKQETEVINDLIYELASLDHDEFCYEIKGDTREELKQSLQEALNKMKEV